MARNQNSGRWFMALVRDNQPRIWDFSVLHRQLPWRVLPFLFPLFTETRMRAIWMSVDPYPGRLLKRTYVYNAYRYSTHDDFNTCISQQHALKPIMCVSAQIAAISLSLFFSLPPLLLFLSLRAIISNINIIQSCVAASIRPNKQHQSINKLFNVREKLLRGNRVMTRARIDGTTFSAKQNLIKSPYRRTSVYTRYASNSM